MAKWLADPIKKKLESGKYDSDPAEAVKNLAKLQTYIDAPKKHKELQTAAKELHRTISERIEKSERPQPISEPAPPVLFPVAEEKRSSSSSSNSSASNSSSEASLEPASEKKPQIPVEPVIVPEAAPLEEPRPNPNPCPILYDPCTKEPLTGMPELEKRIRELKRQNDTTPVGLYGLTNATTNYEFVMGPFLDKTIPLDDLVSFRLNAGGQVGSDIYEVLSRMFVFFGGITDVNPQQGGNYQFMEKVEAAAPRVFAGPKEAFMAMKCKADSTSGVSDITLTRTPGAAGGAPIGRPYCESDCSVAAEGVIQTYIMSVKWYKQDRNAEHYDLEKLKATADTIIPAEGKPYGIIVFLKSKRDFERAHQRASRQYIRHIGKTYFGWEEDVKPFLQDIRRQLFEEAELRGLSPARILEDRYFVAGAKPTLGLQLHQEIITQSVCNTIATSEDNRYLVGVLPRGGKTYIAGGIIREYIRRTEARKMNILWLTAAPTETRSQVGADLIQKFQDFTDFDFIDVRDTIKLTKHNPFSFFFCSTQLLTQTAAGIGNQNRLYIDRLLKDDSSLGMIFYDEAHKTATGEKTGEEIDKIKKAYAQVKLPLIFLTATYYNILFDYKILQENTFIWDYTDVLKTRGLATSSDQEAAIDNLKARFRNAELVQHIIERRQANGESIEAMGKPYLDFPELYFISADIQEEARERFEAQAAYRPDAGLSMKSIFAIRDGASPAEYRTAAGGIRADAYRIFENLVNPRNMISLITPSAEGFEDREEGGTPLVKEARAMLEPTILGRINALSRAADSRFRLDQNPTLMMFMPTGGQGSNIFKTLCAWATLLMSHPWWRERYEVACVVDPKGLTEEERGSLVGAEAVGAPGVRIIRADPKSEILRIERELHCPAAGVNSKGLVVLAGQKLSMGVSLPCTDVVFLLNDSKSPDDIIQKMYRGLTPSPGKKAAFVVDLNPVRTLAAVYGYTRAASGTAMTSSAILNVIYDTYSWDADVYDMNLGKGGDARPQQFQEKLRQLFEEAEKDPEYRVHEDFGGIERAVGENIQRFVTTGMLSAITEYLSEKRVGSAGLTISLRDGATATLKKGQLVIRSPPVPVAEGEEAPVEDTIVIENFIEAVKDFVKYLAITTQESSLDDAVQEYASDEGFQKNIDNLMIARGAITKRDPRIIEVMLATIRELSARSRGMTRMFDDTKAKMGDSETRQTAVLKTIYKRLTPRKKEKEDSGEVFTPIELIESMLSHLPKSFWKNPDLKWLDPANGIGNFPVVVFYKLDEGLKDVIPNDKARRKHIVEKMIFMAEFRSSNSRIARNIFEKLCRGSTPNIWTIDSLTLTAESLKAHGWPEKYDIIMGNPPYNSKGITKGGGTFWPKFVKLAFDIVSPNGYITFVHPPGWRKFYDAEDRDNQGKIWYTIKEKGWNLDYINVSDQPPKHFPIVDYYVIHAKKTDALTKYDSKFMGIVGTGETILDYPFIPNMLNDETMRILRKLFDAKGEPIHIVYNQVFKPAASDKDNSGVSHYHFTSRTGEKQIYKKEYTSIPEYITKDKVIMTFNGGYEKGKLFAFYSDERMGTTNNSMYMLASSKAQGDKLVKFFNSDIVTFLMKITQYSASPNHKNEFKILNQLQMPDSLDYGLTAKEKDLISKVVGAKEANISEEHVSEGGGRRSKYGRTRKARRFW